MSSADFVFDDVNWGEASDDPQVHRFFKLVNVDFTTRGGFRWPFPGGTVSETTATRHDDPCPRFSGDGLCVAKTFGGACSGGLRVAHSVGLIVDVLSTDVLAEDSEKARCSTVTVVDVFDPESQVREGHVENLRDANLWGANLRHAVLRGADLWRAVLRGADLRYADLRGADLRYAVLRHADLRGADLRHADLRGADLRYADLRHADLRGADLRGARANQWTRFPEGFDPQGRGVVSV